jgi:hypothetical protein
MLAEPTRWSHPRGKTPVPSSWQMTFPQRGCVEALHQPGCRQVGKLTGNNLAEGQQHHRLTRRQNWSHAADVDSARH